MGDHHQAKGGLRSMGETLKRGMVLSVSIWDDFATQMRWLDSKFPPHESADKPGVLRGPCNGETNHPDHVRKNYPDASVKYSNIKYGEIGSTFTSGPSPQLGPQPSPARSPQPTKTLSNEAPGQPPAHGGNRCLDSAEL